ncbi:UNKNOWN [Stylonychia lemnae]|uniref:Leucine rich repeat family protein n=1 Tax=Stylonychia lemnae TaxID=5949 RepID=A0A078AP32_STYLE|nr:UNKNOWN [Stylonychia lemnae]|eukprot:CDW83691.1 UNKNOWN [Stylonychia lemnae]
MWAFEKDQKRIENQMKSTKASPLKSRLKQEDLISKIDHIKSELKSKNIPNQKQKVLDSNKIGYQRMGLFSTVLEKREIIKETFNENVYKNDSFDNTQIKLVESSNNITIVEVEDDMDDHQGERGALNFYRTYKDLPRQLQQERGPNSLVDYGATAFLNQVEKLKITPKPFIINREARNHQRGLINLNQYSIGDEYAQAISSSLIKLKPNIINAANNRLSSKGVISIIKQINSLRVEQLDISDNKFDIEAIRELTKSVFMPNSDSNITYLNLSKNKLGDEAIKILCQSLLGYKSLTKLDLSKTEVTNDGAKSIGHLLEHNNELKELVLSWNKIRSQGGLLIAHGLRQNGGLRKLDLSWNSIGSGKEGALGEELGKALNYENLVHLDISHNKISKVDMIMIGEAIHNNHKLFGIHIAGNDGCFLDSQGFIRIQHQNKQPSQVIVTAKRLQKQRTSKEGAYILDDSLDADQMSIRIMNGCWLCEEWREMKFEWIDINRWASRKGHEQNVYIHFEFDDYEGDQMIKERDQKYIIWRMVPPGIHRYFISILKFRLSFVHNQKFIDNLRSFDIKDSKSGETLIVLTPDRLNIANAHPQKDLFDWEKFSTKSIHICTPRNTEKIFKKEMKKKPTPLWHRQDSIFRNFKILSEDTLIECFEFDWNAMCKPRFKENSNIEQIKGVLRKGYPYLQSYSQQKYCYRIEIYRVMSAKYQQGNVFCISYEGFFQLMEKFDLIDNDDLKIEVDKAYKKCAQCSIDSPFVVDGYLVRFQFLEMILRVIIAKYLKCNIFFFLCKPYIEQICETIVESINKFLNDEFLPQSKCDRTMQEWRDKRFWNEQCDNFLQNHYDLFRHIYEKFAGKSQRQGRKFINHQPNTLMNLEDFKQFICQANLLNDMFKEEDIAVCFNQAKLLHVDEIYNDNHIKLTFDEFLEAFARVCDQASHSPMIPIRNPLSGRSDCRSIGSSYNVTQLYSPANSLTFEQTMNQTDREFQYLVCKMDNVVDFLLINTCKNEFRESFVKPWKDFATGLFVVQPKENSHGHHSHQKISQNN